MSDYSVLQTGAPEKWREYFGGFRDATSRDGRRVVDHQLEMQYIGLTLNALEVGEEAGDWHSHSNVEEVYVFISGRGQMGLDDEVIEVVPGTIVRVGQGVWRTWRVHPESTDLLRWLCIRSGGEALPYFPEDSSHVHRPMPW